MSNVLSTGSVARKPKWYALTLPRLLLAVLVMQVFFFLSAQYRWFWLNEQKGYTVLVTVAATAILLLLFFAFVLVSRFFKSKAQFGLSTLLLMVPVVAIPVGWLAREIDLARQQREAIRWISDRRGDIDTSAASQRRFDRFRRGTIFRYLNSLENRLCRALGTDFFDDVTHLSISKPEALDRIHVFRQLESLECPQPIEFDLSRLRGLNHLRKLKLMSTKLVGTRLEPLRDLPALEKVELTGTETSDEDLEPLTQLEQLKDLGLARTKVTDAGVERLKGMTQLELLDLWGTQVTDEGLEHLKEFSRLMLLELKEAQVTPEGVKKLRRALPGCLIMD